jgi:hypothetical protein
MLPGRLHESLGFSATFSEVLYRVCEEKHAIIVRISS